MDPTILIILVFIVAPLIEKLLKAGKADQQPPPPRPRAEPRPRMESQRSRELPGAPTQTSRERAGHESAADVLPDDLWEILTGERRVPAPRPQPTEPEYGLEYDPAEEDEEDAAPPATWLPAPEPEPEPARERPDAPFSYDDAAPELFERPLPVRAPPQIVSLERTSFDPERRHDAFHDRLDGLAAPVRGRRPKRPLASEIMTDAELRKAIIMTEILGPPKGLD